ncbi:MAG TPA: hypothetical protein PLU71_04340 [Candidatus Dependentiae bacterium]|nr:hypothetical protein [Candidatus Dependentiae bacterium]HRQ63062.1 hypothetical protein [Candidatus Dependentiae bacterium]
MKKLILLLLSFPTVYAMQDLPKSVQSNLPWTFEELQEDHNGFELIGHSNQYKILNKLIEQAFSEQFWTNQQGRLLAYAIWSGKLSQKRNSSRPEFERTITSKDTPEGLYIMKQLKLLNESKLLTVYYSGNGFNFYNAINPEMSKQDAVDLFNRIKKAKLRYSQEFLSSESVNSCSNSSAQSNLPWTFEELQEDHKDFKLIGHSNQYTILGKLIEQAFSEQFWINQQGRLLAYAIWSGKLSQKNNSRPYFHRNITSEDTPEGLYIMKQLKFLNKSKLLKIYHRGHGFNFYEAITSEMSKQDAVALFDNIKKAESYYFQEFLSSESVDSCSNLDDDSNSSSEL